MDGLKADCASGSTFETDDSSKVRSGVDPELLRRFGITRVGDVTDLDVLGVPVWFAARPNSRGLSVSQGKGLTDRQARISAIMEAIEGAVAEDTQSHVCAFGSVTDIRRRGMSVIPFETVGRVDASGVDPNRERAWVRGLSIRNGSDILAPFELIGMDFRADFPWDRQAFHMSSEGLAAGFDYDRTILHALLELIENDACFLIDAFEMQNVAPRPVALKSAVNLLLDGLMERLSGLGLSVRFYDLTTDLGVPVVMASLQRPVLATSGPTVRRSAGVACRLNIHDAALAALLEAIQSRLTDISGARDDLSPARYRRDGIVSEWRSSEGTIEIGSSGLEFAVEDDVPLWKAVARHVFAAGVGDIYVFTLDTGVPGLHVVRVLASGLSATGTGLQQMKPRMLEHFLSGRRPS